MAETDASAVCEQVNECRRAVMDLYGGNLDHPALDHLEAAMTALGEVDAELRRAAQPLPFADPPITDVATGGRT